MAEIRFAITLIVLLGFHTLLGTPETIPLEKLKVLAEKTLGALVQYCDVQALTCNFSPNNVDKAASELGNIVPKAPAILEPITETDESFNKSGNYTHHDGKIVENPFISPFIPPNWMEYLVPGTSISSTKLFSEPIHVPEKNQGEPLEQFCEGDLLNVDCSAISQLSQNAVNKNLRWPKSTIPFIIDEEIKDNLLRDDILEAMIMVSNSTCVKFVQADILPPADYIIFVKGSQYASPIGRGIRQTVLIPDQPVTDETRGKVLHLLMHVLGFGHEHNRRDRDNYLWINYANIADDHLQDISNATSGNYAFMGTPYDYDSITHYDNFKFAKNRQFPTILPRAKSAAIGQRSHLSTGDILKINKLYVCGTVPIGQFSTAAVPVVHQRVEKDLDMVVEDTASRHGTPFPPVDKANYDGVQQSCPVCVCSVPQYPSMDTVELVTPESMHMAPPTAAPVLFTSATPHQTQTSSPVVVQQAFDPVAWQKMKTPNPMDHYVKQMMQGALQNSGLGFLFNKETSVPVQGQQTSSQSGSEQIIYPKQQSRFLPSSDQVTYPAQQQRELFPNLRNNFGLPLQFNG